jgi:ParB family chromosome partitioning protein
MSIVENVQREDLNPIERWQAYKRLIDEFGLGTNEVARKLGKSAPTISNTIRLLSLPDAIKDALVAGVITEGHVRPLISLGDPKLMLELFKRILKENSTVRTTEDMARQVKSEVQQKEPRAAKDKIYIPQLDEMARSIGEKLGANTKVLIDQTRAKAKMRIEISGPPEETTQKLESIHKILLGGQTNP